MVPSAARNVLSPRCPSHTVRYTRQTTHLKLRAVYICLSCKKTKQHKTSKTEGVVWDIPTKIDRSVGGWVGGSVNQPVSQSVTLVGRSFIP